MSWYIMGGKWLAMDLGEYMRNLSATVRQIRAASFLNYVLIPPANKLLATIKNRIMKEGKNSSGGLIGDYSTKPMYVTRDQFVKKSAFKPTAQTGYTTEFTELKINPKTSKFIKSKKTQIRAITPRGKFSKSMYLERGYQQLREIQGMQTDKVDLTYFTSMMQNYQLGKSNEKKQVLLGFSSNEEYRKAMENEAHFKARIFSGSTDELETYKREVRDAYTVFIAEKIKGQYGTESIE